MSKATKIDMTTGPIMRKVFLFALPIIIGNVLQLMYTTVDTVIIGRFCGDDSLAAVGTSSQPVEVVLCIFLGIGTGISILVSQYIGMGNKEKVKRLTDTAVFFIYSCGIPLCIIGFLVTPAILYLMKVPASSWDAATAYTRIIFLGTLGNIGYNVNAGILRGMGDSKASLQFLLVSCISNIILDVLFVAGLGMDVEGAALSTMISMYISWFISIFYIRAKFKELEYGIFPKKFYPAEMKHILTIGLPIGLNHSLYSMGHVALQTLVNEQSFLLGSSSFMAGVSIGTRITGLTNVAITALSSSATTFAGQNFGAQKYDRLRKGGLRIPVISGAIALTVGLCVLAFRMPICGIFSDEEQTLLYATRYVFILMLSQWLFAIFNGIIATLNGVGLIHYTTVVNILMLWAIRIPSAYLISRFFDGTYLMLCYPLSFSFGLIMMLGYYVFSPKWKEIIRRESPVKIEE